MYDETRHTQVKGHGVAVGGGIQNQTTIAWQAERSVTTFKKVPSDKKLIITDFVYFPQGSVTSRLIVDAAELSTLGTAIFLQLFVEPHVVTQAHFQTGFIIEPGNSVDCFGTGPSTQHVTVTLLGYLAPA
ncbi:MAG: hypothetical protein U1E25_11235 [Methylocystis sp.]